MQKVIVIGCPGSGKSTFARELHNITKLPLVHLDMLNWNADRTTVPREVFRRRLEDALRGDNWIIDGNYGSTMEMRMAACDTVIFLDYPVEVCLRGVSERRGKKREDLPWIERENEPEDEEFLEFIKNYDNDGRPQVMALLEKYAEKKIIRFSSRAQAQEYLEKLRNFQEES